MTRAIALLVVLPLGLFGCGDDAVGGAGGGDSSSQGSGAPAEEPEAMAGMTAAHNEARASVDPAAETPIPPLVWDGGLAASAQAYADECVFEHSGGPTGENLYASAGRQSTVAQVVDAWASEDVFYDHATNTCSGVCGHYTQIVWADTRRLGCGMAACSVNSPFAGFVEWENWVCHYDPPGNWVGEKPY